MKTFDGKCIIPIKGIDYVLFKDYVELLEEKEKQDKFIEFNKAYIHSLRRIIYKLYKNIELSTLEMHVLLQSIEENEDKGGSNG